MFMFMVTAMMISVCIVTKRMMTVFKTMMTMFVFSNLGGRAGGQFHYTEHHERKNSVVPHFKNFIRNC